MCRNEWTWTVCACGRCVPACSPIMSTQLCWVNNPTRAHGAQMPPAYCGQAAWSHHVAAETSQAARPADTSSPHPQLRRHPHCFQSAGPSSAWGPLPVLMLVTDESVCLSRNLPERVWGLPLRSSCLQGKRAARLAPGGRRICFRLGPGGAEPSLPLGGGVCLSQVPAPP